MSLRLHVIIAKSLHKKTSRTWASNYIRKAQKVFFFFRTNSGWWQNKRSFCLKKEEKRANFQTLRLHDRKKHKTTERKLFVNVKQIYEHWTSPPHLLAFSSHPLRSSWHILRHFRCDNEKHFHLKSHQIWMEKMYIRDTYSQIRRPSGFCWKVKEAWKKQ